MNMAFQPIQDRKEWILVPRLPRAIRAISIGCVNWFIRLLSTVICVTVLSGLKNLQDRARQTQEPALSESRVLGDEA
jgi:hypothetical protein